MIVEELIEALGEYPSDTRVVVQGYEEGFDDVSALHSIQIEEHPDPKWYHGNYDKSSEEGEPAVLIFGRPRADI
jgi:hypothetical protein